MRNIKSSTAALLLIFGGFVFCLCLSGLVPSRVSADSTPAQRPNGNARRKGDKLSETLRGRTSEDETVQVILQLNSSPTGRLNALLQRSGVHLKDEFKQFNSFLVELPVSL